MSLHDEYRYGLLMPHFGAHASRENLLEGARAAEAYGFDSVWVRDHLVFHPHGMEGQDRTHIDPFVSLAAIAGATDTIKLGTGSLIPYRHPIQLALSLTSLERVAGPGRVIAGFGIGTFDHEFEAVGLGGIKRGDLLREQVDIMRKLWTGESVSFEGQFYRFDGVDIHPSPAGEGSIPIVYCGNSVLSVRKAVEYCDGWMPGRITVKTFRKRVERLAMLSDEAGREMPEPGAIPIVSPGKTREEALAHVNWPEMMEQAIKSKWETPDSGGWTTPDDLEGALIAGDAADIAEATAKFHDAGLKHLVYDLRFRYADWLDCLRFLGEEVLPLVRRPAAATVGATS